MTPNISDGELIVGKAGATLPEEKEAEWQSKYYRIWQDEIAPMSGGQDSHMAIDYDLVLNCGINGIIEKIDEYKKRKPESSEFYDTCRRCLEAVTVHSEKYANHALELASRTTDAKRKKELETIASVCRKVTANPAESFYEAVQSVSFITHCVSFNPYRPHSQQFQLGHPDRYLYPFYKKDIEAGILTREYAQLLLDCLGIQRSCGDSRWVQRLLCASFRRYAKRGTDAYRTPYLTYTK